MNDHKPTHIIITGSAPRNGDAPLTDDNWSWTFRLLDQIHRNVIISSITQGAASGFDTIGKSWAELNNVQCHDYPANWPLHGKSAGPIRNEFMVRDTITKFGVDNIAVVALTNKPLEQSRGTANCVAKALERGLKVHHYRVDKMTKEF